VGYGDVVPITIFGRITVVVFGIFGGSLLLALLVAVFVDVTTPTDSEREVMNMVEYHSTGKLRRRIAVMVLQLACRRFVVKCRVRAASRNGKNEQVQSLSKRLCTIEHELYDMVHQFRMMRKLQLDMKTDKDRDEKVSNLLVDITEYMFGGLEHDTQYHLDSPLDVALGKVIRRQHHVERRLDGMLELLSR
jgi:hypothetical protein